MNTPALKSSTAGLAELSRLPVIVAVDVCYTDGNATGAGVVFAQWDQREPDASIVVSSSGAHDYVPGQFYLRELPSIRSVLQRVEAPVGAVVVDGYVTLGCDGHAGLGFRLWEALHGAVPVIGVAKSRFAGTPDDSQILRGKSHRPLYVTAVGLSLVDAKAHIQSMHGPYRIPTLLQRVDQLCRSPSTERDVRS